VSKIGSGQSGTTGRLFWAFTDLERYAINGKTEGPCDAHEFAALLLAAGLRYGGHAERCTPLRP
jgi:hypothetical protein